MARNTNLRLDFTHWCIRYFRRNFHEEYDGNIFRVFRDPQISLNVKNKTYIRHIMKFRTLCISKLTNVMQALSKTWFWIFRAAHIPRLPATHVKKLPPTTVVMWYQSTTIAEVIPNTSAITARTNKAKNNLMRISLKHVTHKLMQLKS